MKKRCIKLNRMFFNFIIVGVFATLIHVVIFTILVEFFIVNAVIASLPAFLLSMLTSYIANHKWTFQATGDHHIYLPKYAFVSIIGLFINVLITYIVINIMGYLYGIALVLVIITVPSVTFLLNRIWTYKVKLESYR